MDELLSNVYDARIKMKRNEYLTSIFYHPWAACLDFYYTINFRNTEILKQLDDKGFVMLPKHQSALDIILEGMLLKRVLGRYGNYVMKDSLPKWLEYIGGISITQGKHLKRMLKKNKNRHSKRDILQEAKERRDYVDNTILNLLLMDEIVVVHSEGTRSYKEPFSINVPNIKKLLDIQKKLGKDLTFVPLNIKYEDKSKYRSSIELIVGNPINVPDNGLDKLVEHLMIEIPNNVTF